MVLQLRSPANQKQFGRNLRSLYEVVVTRVASSVTLLRIVLVFKLHVVFRTVFVATRATTFSLGIVPVGADIGSAHEARFGFVSYGPHWDTN